MHMADALVSPAVGGVMTAVSAVGVGYAVRKSKDSITEKRIPVMGVMGAFVFAAQMINFVIPGTGSSGHIGGGMLLAALLGPFPAVIVMTAILLVQALFFADGGLLALGCNVFNMAVIPCLLVFPLLYKTIVKNRLNKKNIAIASVIAVIVSLQLGAFGVVLETMVSGITSLPTTAFLLLMQPIHLAIGAAEGVITAMVLCFVYSHQPALLRHAVDEEKFAKKTATKKLLTGALVATVLIGGVFSLFASANPDGLEWSIEQVAGTEGLEAEGAVYESAGNIQKVTSFLPDYNFKQNPTEIGTSLSGILGAGMTLVLIGGTGWVIYRVKKKKTE